MRGIWRKLGSRRGASITFALLLFLVCSVLCVVVLAAGSTASGRMAGVSQADQRYYAVGSMAELLQNALVGKTVQVRYTDDKPEGEAPSFEVVKDDVDVVDGKTDLADTVALRVAESIVTKKDLEPKQLTLTISTEPADIGKSLECSIREHDRRDGRVIFEVSCPPVPGTPATPETPTEGRTATYTLQVGFAATISESSEEHIEAVEGGGTKKVRTVTVTVKWDPKNVTIRKGAVPVIAAGGT